MDEVDEPQKPLDMLFILKALADLKVPVQTIAPKFTGRFNKGVDYQGDVGQFGKEFEEDMLVIDYAIAHFGLRYVDRSFPPHSLQTGIFRQSGATKRTLP